MKNFVKAVGYKFVISETGSHISASVFGEDATIVFSLDQATSQDDFVNVAGGLEYFGDEESNLDNALITIRNEVFTLDGFSRQKVPKVLVVLTASDCSTCIENVGELAKELKKDGIQILAIPIGDRPKQADMDAIASLPYSQFVHPQTTFSELLNGVFIQRISTMICSGKPGVCVEPPLPEECERIVYNCDVDIDCPSARKCCFKNCEKSCTDPVTGSYFIFYLPVSGL